MKTKSRITKVLSIVIAFILSLSFLSLKAFAKSEDTEAMDWDKFSSTYYYSQMTPAQKNFYDRLYEDAMEALTTTKTYEGGYMTSILSEDFLDWEQAYDIVTTFINSNPQFYFLEGYVLRQGWYDGTFGNHIALTLYDEFANGTERAAYTEQFASTVNRYIDIINHGKTDYEKEKIAHGIIASRLDYELESPYNQSSASAFLTTKSVCAGYSEGLELLLNGVGIECITVTSKDHEWVQAKIDGVWYAVDVTWDDTGADPEEYLNVSDATLLAKDEKHGGESHTPRERYTLFNRPVCEIDYENPKSGAIYGDGANDYGTNGVYMSYEGNIALFRLYNPRTGEHFYTTDIAERRLYIQNGGWIPEGIAGFFPAASTEDTETFYRFLNPNTGEHHYAMDEREIEMITRAGWINEGVAFYSPKISGDPIHRLYNPNAVTGTHFYTISEGERDILISYGWRYEGIAWRASEYDGDGFTVSGI